jgi:hypothetical protein
MALVDVKRVRAAVWRWLCKCPEAIGPLEDSSSDNDFFTPPTTPLHDAEEPRVATIPQRPSTLISPPSGAERLLSPAQTARLRRRHAEVVRQLTTPPPVVEPPPTGTAEGIPATD